MGGRHIKKIVGFEFVMMSIQMYGNSKIPVERKSPNLRVHRYIKWDNFRKKRILPRFFNAKRSKNTLEYSTFWSLWDSLYKILTAIHINSSKTQAFLLKSILILTCRSSAVNDAIKKLRDGTKYWEIRRGTQWFFLFNSLRVRWPILSDSWLGL